MFDNILLLLHHHLQPRERPTQVPLFSGAFWIQVHDLPIGYMAESVGKQLGNLISIIIWRHCMRIRVVVDVLIPFSRYKMIKLRNGNLHRVNFKHERLGTFYFMCGMLSHAERFCPTAFYDGGLEQKREWGSELRAPTRRGGGQQTSRWLRFDERIPRLTRMRGPVIAPGIVEMVGYQGIWKGVILGTRQVAMGI